MVHLDPPTTHIHYTRFDWINSNWAHWNNSYKACFAFGKYTYNQ